MMSFLQTGKALYVLAVICFGGIFCTAGSRKLLQKTDKKKAQNMALTKNR